LPALLGWSRHGREHLVEHDGFRTLAFRDGLWKYIEPDARPHPVYGPGGSLYDLGRDLGETNDLHAAQPGRSRKLSGELNAEEKAGRATGQKMNFQ
jgi:hypothetical protein